MVQKHGREPSITDSAPNTFPFQPTMSTIFNAVQCFQCSTMQVKQQKKSSNKWTCVICNEKQSVRKVFAQGFIARDVRKFVQSFNMSRHFAEQQQRVLETLDPLPEDTDNQPLSHHEKRRTDWSEYIDTMENHDGQEEDEPEDVFGPRFVTELPTALFKKQKLNTGSSGLGVEDGEKGFRPVALKRNSNEGNDQRKVQPTTANWLSKRFAYNKSQGEGGMSAVQRLRKSLAKGDSKWRTYDTQEVEAEPRACYSAIDKVSSKWSEYIIQDNNEDPDDKGPWKCQLITMKGASKWDNYITEDDGDGDGDLKLKNERQFADHKGSLDDNVIDAKLYDQNVEEDIHPDFL